MATAPSLLSLLLLEATAGSSLSLLPRLEAVRQSLVQAGGATELPASPPPLPEGHTALCSAGTAPGFVGLRWQALESQPQAQ